jgi:hypothetical protein
MANRSQVSRTAEDTRQQRDLTGLVAQASPDGLNGDAPATQPGLMLPPLVVSGLVVTTADLLAALRVYVPLAIDISPLDGERFVLTLPTRPREQIDTETGENTNG